jgi:hypothetical protein
MRYLVSASLVLAGIVHLLPLSGAMGVVAAFRPSLQPIAFIAAFVSVLSFLLLAWSSGGYNALVGRVVTADLVALVALVIGVAAYTLNTNP